MFDLFFFKMENEILNFSKLVDSSVRGGIITNNQDMENTKEKITECSLNLNNINGDTEHFNFFIDYETLYNLSYQMKSMINQIDESIKNFGKS